MRNVVRGKSRLRHDQSLVFYPSFGTFDPARREWKINIRGLVYHPSPHNLRRRLLVRLLRRAMSMQPAELQSEIFQQRINSFLIQHQRGSRFWIQVGNKTYRLRRKTRRNGHFGGVLRLSDGDIESLREEGHVQGDWLHFAAAAGSAQNRPVSGAVQLIPPHGVTVISDIDDTIKCSEVGSRRALLENTFLREFRSVPGMASLYRNWQAQGASFHYVSTSPWQLFDALAEMCDEAQFPAGSYHLRKFRLRDPTVLTLLVPSRRSKRAAIRSILRAFPRRQFILVGDSGEKDPEIYGAATRKYSGRVAQVLIRDLPHRTMDADRRRRAFRNLPATNWQLFRDSDEIPADLARFSAITIPG